MATPDPILVDDAPQGGSTGSWDAKVVGDLMSLGYTRAIVFTDCRGQVRHAVARSSAPEDIAEVADIALSMLARAGSALKLGALAVSACMYQEGTLILARSGKNQVAVLAEEHANLGQLLNHVRRIFNEEQEA